MLFAGEINLRMIVFQKDLAEISVEVLIFYLKLYEGEIIVSRWAQQLLVVERITKFDTSFKEEFESGLIKNRIIKQT